MKLIEENYDTLLDLVRIEKERLTGQGMMENFSVWQAKYAVACMLEPPVSMVDLQFLFDKVERKRKKKMPNSDIVKTLIDGLDVPVSFEILDTPPEGYAGRHVGSQKWTWLRKLVHAMANRPGCGALRLEFPNKREASLAQSAAQNCNVSHRRRKDLAVDLRTRSRRNFKWLLEPTLCARTNIKPVDSKTGAYFLTIWLESREDPNEEGKNV